MLDHKVTSKVIISQVSEPIQQSGASSEVTKHDRTESVTMVTFNRILNKGKDIYGKDKKNDDDEGIVIEKDVRKPDQVNEFNTSQEQT